MSGFYCGKPLAARFHCSRRGQELPIFTGLYIDNQVVTMLFKE